MSVRVLYSYLFAILVIFLSNRTFPQNNYNQLPTPLFETISVENGLPENSVTCILQDYLGYMWFGTQNGLVKYDGYSMKVFKPDSADNRSISGREIIYLFEDKNKTLWVGTLNGLNRFNREDESFVSYEFNQDDSTSISCDYVHTIYEDKSGRFWVGTLCGLNLFDRENEIFARFYFIEPELKTAGNVMSNQSSLAITAVTEDPVSGDLLLGTGLKGLWKFDISKKTISKYNPIESSEADINASWVQNLYRARDGRIWISMLNGISVLDPVSREFKSYIDFPIRTEERYAEPYFLSSSVIEDQYGNIAAGFFAGEKGLFYMNPNTGDVNNFELIPNNSHNTMLNKIHSLYEDRSGIIWIGTWSTGVKKWNRYKNKFSVIQSSMRGQNNLSSPIIYSLICDPRGYTWYCTPKGLDRYNQRTHTYTHYLGDVKCVTDFMVYAMMLDHSGNLWLGTSNCGLVRFNTQNFSYQYFLNDPDKQNLIDKTVLYLIQDHLGFIWIGTQGFGLYQYNPDNGSLVQFINDPNDSLSLGQNEVLSILEDHNGDIWVGTNLGGLYKFNRETGKFYYAGFKNCLSLYEDSEKRFWIIELISGLNLFDTEKFKVITAYDQKKGMGSNSGIGVLEDYMKNLWLITDRGITKVNPVTGKIRNFAVENNLSNVFNFYFPCCTGIGIDGTFYLNTRVGLVIINPADIKDDPVPPQVQISNLSLFNRQGESLNYTGFISELKEVTLPYDQNDLRFDYVGLQFNEPLKNTYKYILENFDEDWVEAGTQRNAVYTNLSPGEYVLKVKAANRDGVWSTDEASIKIIITPPWWKTNFAYILYAVILISIVYLIWKMQLKRIKIKQEYEMSRFEAEKLHEVDEIKSRFFTNISHEFRTPLTLILGPVKRLAEKIADENVKKELNMVHRNASKLLSLVNQLLDISKIESGNMKLQAAAQDIAALIKALALSFTSYAERKNIRLTVTSSSEEIKAYADKEKIENIINNLLSNAFKFTPEGGSIGVSVTEKSNRCIVKVSDTGIGIPREKISNIFDRFYQVDGSHRREYEGTGIGLALTKELVELHKGTIEAESVEGKGTTFTVNIPLGKEHLKVDRILEDEKVIKSVLSQELAEEPDLVSQKFDAGSNDGDSLPVLLIVEDNQDVRNYIKNNLKEDYNIIEAADGEDGWNKSSAQIPELIISDVMMPGMDGFELCRKLKTDERTSHIPVILLTAKAAKQDKLNGLEIGADEYIMKPFDSDELEARIKNLLEQRRRIHEHFRKNGLIELDESKITPIDKKFLQNTTCLIIDNISDISFGVEKLAESLNMSRSVLHKKVVSLTGEPPVELVKTIRMTRAAELIRRKTGNISEIALEVGFKNPAYFSECFKKQFGISPLQYSRRFSSN